MSATHAGQSVWKSGEFIMPARIAGGEKLTSIHMPKSRLATGIHRGARAGPAGPVDAGPMFTTKRRNKHACLWNPVAAAAQANWPEKRTCNVHVKRVNARTAVA